MKLTMALTVLALVACGGSRNDAPAKEPVSTTRTTSAAMTVADDSPATPSESGITVVAAKPTDQSLGTKIRSHLQRDKDLSNVGWQHVSVEIVDAHVTLRGELPTVADSSEMERCIREVKGVKAVSNDIHVPQ